MSLMLLAPVSHAMSDADRSDLPVKPTKQRAGVQFKVRGAILKGPKAKNQRVWNDRSRRKSVGTKTARTRKGAKGHRKLT